MQLLCIYFLDLIFFLKFGVFIKKPLVFLPQRLFTFISDETESPPVG